MTNQNNVLDYPLFNDIEDADLRTHNRANIMSNIAETYYDEQTTKFSVKGAAIIGEYFLQIPDEEKKSLYDKFVEVMKNRGFSYAA